MDRFIFICFGKYKLETDDVAAGVAFALSRKRFNINDTAFVEGSPELSVSGRLGL